MTSRQERIKNILKNLPQKPGVYLMRNAEGRVIYVGKAKKLKRRVSSYFFHKNLPSPKLRRLVSEIDDLSFIRVNSEAEALIVESRLIKKLQPFFNVELKMGAKYPYVVLTDEPFPRLVVTRVKSLKGRYFGPYTAAGALHGVLRLIDSLFPLRDCKLSLPLSRPMRPCLSHALGRCDAPCVGLIDGKEYGKRVDDIVLLLSGQTVDLISRLRVRMDAHSASLHFEEAARCRDAIRALWKLTRQRVSHTLSDDLDEDAWQALVQLQQLACLPIVPWRIEGFDITHHQGHETYGVCVVFEQGYANTSLYRRFKIRTVEGIDDFHSMYETVYRKYRTTLERELPLPQLIVIDGGPVQLQFARKALRDLGLDIATLALAKREEEVYLSPEDPPVLLPRYDRALRLIQRVRDESHRYGITTHRKASAARLSRSSLENLSGVGKHTAAQLLRVLGSVARIAEASIQELQQVPGIGPAKAQKLYDQLHKLKGDRSDEGV